MEIAKNTKVDNLKCLKLSFFLGFILFDEKYVKIDGRKTRQIKVVEFSQC